MLTFGRNNNSLNGWFLPHCDWTATGLGEGLSKQLFIVRAEGKVEGEEETRGRARPRLFDRFSMKGESAGDTLDEQKS